MSGVGEGWARDELVVAELQRFVDNYHGLHLPDENVSEGLQSVRNVYDADISFILMSDPDNNIFRIIFALTREDFEGFGGDLTQKVIAKGLFTEIIKPNFPVCITTEELKGSFPEEHEWMTDNRIQNVLLYPILNRAMMHAFIGVCNARRLFGDISMLSFSTYLLTNETRAITIIDRFAKKSNRYLFLEDNDLIVNMFGGLEVWTKRGKLDLGNVASAKCCLLFIYLIFQKDRFVSVRELAEALWPDQILDNPYNMVKGVVFRLKKLLDPICEKKVFVARQGTYILNSELNLHLDTLEFERLSQLLKQPSHTARERRKLYSYAISCYKGSLLPNFEDEIWLVGKISYYQILYQSIVKEFLLFLGNEGAAEDFFAVVSQVLNIIYSDGEIYSLILSVLLKQNRIDIARNFYSKVEKILTAEQRQVFIDALSNAR